MLGSRKVGAFWRSVTGVGTLVLCLVVPTSCGDDLGPRAVDRVALFPDSSHLEPGQTSVHEIVVFDEDNRRMGAEWLDQIDWSVVDPSIGDFQVDGDEMRVTAKATGTVYIWAELADVRRRFDIWVHPPGLDRVEIEPSPLIVGAENSALYFFTRLYDGSGAEMDPDDFRISWKVVDTTLATLNPTLAAGGSPFVRGNGWSDGSTPRAGTTPLYAYVSGERSEHDLRVTLEPTPLSSPPAIDPVSDSELAIVWNEIRDASQGYEVERAEHPEGPWVHLTFTGSEAWFAREDTTYVDAGLSPATTYYYRIRGCSSFGCSVLPSPASAGTTEGGG